MWLRQLPFTKVAVTNLREKITLASDTISREDLEATSEWMLTGAQLTKGEETVKFEEEFASALGVDHAIYVNSGSSANLLVAAALLQQGNLKNNKVICPAVSWVTTVTPFTQIGYDVILCDADPNSLGLDINHLTRLVEEHSPAIVVLVHVLGHPNDMEKIRDLSSEYGFVIMEDTCEAIGTTTGSGAKLGTIGLAGTFSFYYGHHISTIEGGMVVTNDFEFSQIALSIRSHGWSRDLRPEVRKRLTEANKVDRFRNFYTFYFEGFNLRSTDLQAFIGRRQLHSLPRIIESRQKNFFRYRDALRDFWVQDSVFETLSSFAFGTFVENPQLVADTLAARGVESRPLICGNIARQPFWKSKGRDEPLRVADLVHDHGIYLPNHAQLTGGDIDYVSEVFREVAIPIWPG